MPHIMTLHSLEPLRPWKAEQLGTGYALSSWMEREAIASAAALIAVSGAMRRDILSAYPEADPARVHVIHNGIDTTRFRPDQGVDALVRHGIDPERPIVLFVGRVTRQKGLQHLLRAAFQLRDDAQLVLCCGQADTPELGLEVDGLIADLGARRGGVVRIWEMLDRTRLLQLLTHATVFVCPSLYEPMGIVNLEAMAVQTAVVATQVGGIPEVVIDGETGLLVPFRAADGAGGGEPLEPRRLAYGLAEAINALLDDPAWAAELGRAGRRRAEENFSWRGVAERTAQVYAEVLGTVPAFMP
jgi:starch synthase